MDQNEITKIVEEINYYLKQNNWMDFEISCFKNNSLTVNGGLSLSYPPEIIIHFKQVYFLSLPTEWNTDTSIERIFSIVGGEEARSLNLKFQVEQGHHIFKFIPEGFAEGFGCLVCALSVSYELKKIS
jgi:hypothetical protein